jgi:hypothetical protein
MTAPKVVLAKPDRGSRRWTPSPESAWRLVGGVGALFLAVGGLDLVLTWVPLGFGNPEWEFGTVTSMMDGLPVPTLGLVGIVGAARARGSRAAAQAGAVMLGSLALWVVLAGVLYATTLPIALRSVTDPVIRSGLHKAVIKTAVQCVAYPIGLSWLAIAAWRRAERT